MRKNIVLIALVALSLASCQQQEENFGSATCDQIVASIADSPASSRTAIDDATGAKNGVIGVMWTDGDQLGVFDESGSAQRQYNKATSGKVKTASFAVVSGTTAFSAPKFAYYPYDSNNNGKSITQLAGTMPTTQNMDGGTLQGDYKFGTVAGSSSSGHVFEFRHLFSLARFIVDASNSPIAGKKMRSITLSVKRGDNAVAIAGGFTFDAQTGAWQLSGSGSNTTSLTWSDANAPSLSSTVQCYMSLFPTIYAGDALTITVVTTDGYKAELTTNSKATFAQETIYNFPLTLVNYSSVKFTDDQGQGVQSPEGIFTCAAMNVDGLPSLINSDGPGKDGTTTLGTIANNLGWSFLAVSENFDYNTQLTSALTNYNAGTYRGSINLSTLVTQADTDGLGFFWKKDGVTATNETMVEFTDKKGDISHGANENIKKGFRHYEVTVAPGIVIDVYITHMNTYEGEGKDEETNEYVKAVLSQLRQMRDYVLLKAKTNKRPAIIMGDTNMRYTRHKISENFIDYINNNASGSYAGYTVVDPWVKCNRNNTYPTWNTKSMLIRSKFDGTEEAKEKDIICDDQRGEVVDKMWYINVPESPLQLEALSCQNDITNFTKSTEPMSYSGVTIEDESGNILTNQTIDYTKYTGYADHFPVVVKFKWTVSNP